MQKAVQNIVSILMTTKKKSLIFKFVGLGFPGDSDGNVADMWETQVQSLNWEDPLEKGMTIHSSILAWIIPWTKEPGRLQSTGLPW